MREYDRSVQADNSISIHHVSLVSTAFKAFGLSKIGRNVLIASIVVASAVTTNIASAKTLFSADFEVSDIWRYAWKQSGNAPTLGKGEIPACRGNGVMRVSLDRYKDAAAYRTEMTRLTDIGQYGQVTNGKEYWMRMAVYLPSNWQTDGYKKGDIIFQFHDGPDENGVHRNPPMTLKVLEDYWGLGIIGDSRRLISERGDYDVQKTERMKKTKPGTWTTFVLNFKFDYSGGGFVKLWQDGDLQLSYKGRLGFDDPEGPYLKVGLYKPSWRKDEPGLSKRLLYIDELVVADANTTYSDMALGCGGQAIPVEEEIVAPSAPKGIKIELF